MDLHSTKGAPRILFIDAYDSFANNIVALLETSLSARLTTIYIDHPAFINQPPGSFHRLLASFDAVVAGPGPGTATNPRDIGIISALWRLPEDHLLPVLGICLGFQSLAHAFGATIERLPQPRHGIITHVHHRGRSLFDGLRDFHATQYHSLHAVTGLLTACPSEGLWEPTHQCPNLIPLAWDCDSVQNGPVLMAVEHRSNPFCGVQYHPESICTDSEGAKIVQNWWSLASAWLASCSARTHRLVSLDSGKMPHMSTTGHVLQNRTMHSSWDRLYIRLLRSHLINHRNASVRYQCIPAAAADVRQICEVLGVPGHEAVVLESGLNGRGEPIQSETGTRSIIGCLDQGRDLRVDYFVHGQVLELRAGGDVLYCEEGANIWAFLKGLMNATRVIKGPQETPFWGGLVGFVSYETGLQAINVPTELNATPGFRRPDIVFMFITRSIVIDHSAHIVYIQSIRNGDTDWILSTTRKLEQPTRSPSYASKDGLTSILAKATITAPSWTSYHDKVIACQDSIRAGDSYELCVTAQTTIQLPRTSPRAFSWDLYIRLRHLNPAPFGAYIRFGPPGAGVDVLSSSPERFLSWTRRGRCQYRPIKGTVQKGVGVTRMDAERVLTSSKERAENLMIVDLVRHDLHGVVGMGNVRVSKLMGIEEYQTVFQLVSVIEGDLTGQWAREQIRTQEQGSSGMLKVAAVADTRSLVEHSADGHHAAAITPVLPCGSPCPVISASPPLDSLLSSSPPAPTTSWCRGAVPARRQPAHRHQPRPTGIDILHASLPPGSMTGAPKKRSCELLHVFEERQARGIYSGVLGYLDVGGGGDFAVVIRSAWRWDGERAEGGNGERREASAQVWRVGAGGAVTAQSTPEDEHAEMIAKLESVLRVFDANVVV